MTHDYKYAPDLAAEIPTLDNGGVKVPGDNGDAMTVTWKLRDGLKWSDGEDLTCDDFKYAWEWVMDPDNIGVVTSGYEDITAWDCPSDTDMVLHFAKVFEGYITLVVAPLPRHYLSQDPDRGPGRGRRLPARRDRQACRQRRVQVRDGHPGRRAAARQATRTTRAGDRQAGPPRHRSSSSGTATPTR